MVRGRCSRSTLGLAVASVLGACNVEPNGTSQSSSIAAAEPVRVVVVGNRVGERQSTEIVLTGRERVEIPDTSGWSCGHPPRSTRNSNVAWLELSNSSSDTLSVSFELDGLPATHPKLFVYGAKNVPLRECLTFGSYRKLAGASSIVIDPGSSSYVLVAAGAVTGVYTASVTTEHVIPL